MEMDNGTNLTIAGQQMQVWWRGKHQKGDTAPQHTHLDFIGHHKGRKKRRKGRGCATTLFGVNPTLSGRKKYW